MRVHPYQDADRAARRRSARNRLARCGQRSHLHQWRWGRLL
ncbi:hypothetical protein DNR46_32710 [Mesorhizobium japonicum]|uniref:Uncharacterized protein n=1 Tax=Mesorhizobium japonicum TaxID=2066070 RepID=A0A3M9X1M4_9HYPH|nr:hypothetical protein DNR46_32710 [Mesorhizobium japonicum]